MHRQDILRLIENYRTPFTDEAGHINRARRWINSHEEVFERANPVHVTGSAWVVNTDRSRILMVHHGKLHQWFQPGGHADGDHDVRRVALKEVAEESGIDPAQIKLISEHVFDIDIHTIPDAPGEPAHDHIDIRFLVEVDDNLPVPGSHESHEVRWIDLYDVSAFSRNRSTSRMVDKTRQLRNAVRQRSNRY